MGFNRGNSYGNNNGGGYGGGAPRQGGKFEPKPGSGTLFVKQQKRTQSGPDYDGYFIMEFDVRAGEKIKLVGWDKDGPTGNMINLKLGRERQDAPGYNNQGQGGQQGGYGGAPAQGYGNGPQNYGGQAPQQGCKQPPQQGYQAPRGGYQPPPQGQPGSYQGAGYGGQPAQAYPPAGAPLAAAQQPPPAAGPAYAFPPPADSDLPF